MSSSKNHYLNLLFEDLTQAATSYHLSYYSKNIDYSGSYEVDRNKDSFGRLLKEDIIEKTKDKNPLNHRTLINLLKAGFTLNAQQNTLNVISIYLGYESFEDFCANRKEIKIEPQKTTKKNVWPLILTFLAVLGMSLALAFYFFQKRNVEEDQLRKTIEAANAYQFETYKKLPAIDTSQLLKFYTKYGSAKKIIIQILTKHKQKNRVISFPADNPSYFTVQQIFKPKYEKDKIIVETKEHWYLRWYDTQLKKYILKYDVGNKQTYIFKKEGNTWKIDSNDYIGEVKPIVE
jgi:hypothetical protein